MSSELLCAQMLLFVLLFLQHTFVLTFCGYFSGTSRDTLGPNPSLLRLFPVYWNSTELLPSKVSTVLFFRTSWQCRRNTSLRAIQSGWSHIIWFLDRNWHPAEDETHQYHLIPMRVTLDTCMHSLAFNQSNIRLNPSRRHLRALFTIKEKPSDPSRRSQCSAVKDHCLFFCLKFLLWPY